MYVQFYATLRPIVGGKTVQFDLGEGITVRQLLDAMIVRFPPLREQLLDENGELYPHVHIFVNGRDAPRLEQGMETPLSFEDQLDVFPAVAGG